MSTSANAASNPSKSLRILIVDDNYDAAESMTILLGLFGHEVQMRHDGLTAVEAHTSFKPDVIFLDISLPGLDGYGAAGQIRQLPGGDAVVLVALTGLGRDEDIRRSTEAGFNHHLIKPVSPTTLTELLSSIASSTPTGFEV